MANHIYKIKLLRGQGQSTREAASPVIRVLSSSRVEHPSLMESETGSHSHTHLLMRVGHPPPAPTPADPNQPCLILDFGDAQDMHFSAMQDLVFALQCDGIHSVWTHADLPDLAELFAPHAPWSGQQTHRMDLGSAIAHNADDTIAALQASWRQLQTPKATGMLVLRAHAPQAVVPAKTELRQWHSTLTCKPRMLCWDVYDDALKAGQCRVTLLLGGQA